MMHYGLGFFSICIIYGFVISAPIEESRKKSHGVNLSKDTVEPLKIYDADIEKQSSSKKHPDERSTIFIHNSKHRPKQWKHCLVPAKNSEKPEQHAKIHKDFIHQILHASKQSDNNSGLVDPYTLADRIDEPERKILVTDGDRPIYSGDMVEFNNRIISKESELGTNRNKDKVNINYYKPNGFVQMKTPLTRVGKNDVSKLYSRKKYKQGQISKEVLPTKISDAVFELLKTGLQFSDYSTAPNIQSTDSTGGTETPLVTYYVKKQENNMNNRLGKSCRYYSCAMRNAPQGTTKTEMSKKVVLTCRCIQKKGNKTNTPATKKY